LTVRADAPEPLANDDGEKLQLPPLGNPEQDSATAPLNPPADVSFTVVPVELPGFIVAGESGEAAIKKSGVTGPSTFRVVTSPTSGWS
jgi:hypothetical protein